MNISNLWTIFLTGLTTGGLTCLAVQGGLLAAALTRKTTKKVGRKMVTEVKLTSDPLPVAAFLSAKVLIHMVAGFLLGALGSVAQITPTVQGWMQIIAGLFMLATVLNMLDVHPIFRYAVIQPPKAVTRMIRNQSKREALFTPGLLGLLTVLIPCGTTQAMAILAVSSGSPVYGALIMGAFTLGTTPTFLFLGVLATQLRGKVKRVFTWATILLVFVLGMLSIDAGLNVLGSSLAPSRILASLTRPLSISGPATVAQVVNGVQEVTIDVRERGYFPNNISVKRGQPIRIRLVSNDVYSCARIFRIPDMRILRVMDVTDQQTIELPAQQPGVIYFTCSMGMYNGQIVVT